MRHGVVGRIMTTTPAESRESDPGVTVRLAAFCSTLTYDRLDEPTVEAVRKAFVDTLGAAYAGTTTDAGRRMLRYVGSLGGDEATVIGNDGEGGRSLAHVAALANGTTAHALDVDDGHRAASAHPGSAVIPAALALGEKHGCSGEELVTAIVAGYEAMVRTAEAVQTSHRERGFHATGTAGCVGAGAAASRVLGLDPTETAHALGLAGTQAGGLFEFMEKGSMAKRFHPGRAAMAGVVAAELAAVGFDGPDTILEGDDGFAAAFADESDLSTFDGLGEPCAVVESYLKPYPCCRHIHGPIQAVLELRTDGLDADAVERIEVQTYRSASYHDKREITTLLDAQMSLPYGVAVALATGDASLERFDPANAAREDVAAVIRNTTVVATDEMEARYPEARPARVVVETTDGQRLEREVAYPKGAAETPLSTEELAEKFRDLTRGVVPDGERDAVFEHAFALDEYGTVEELTARL